jgi:hypothetical protein
MDFVPFSQTMAKIQGKFRHSLAKFQGKITKPLFESILILLFAFLLIL